MCFQYIVTAYRQGQMNGTIQYINIAQCCEEQIWLMSAYTHTMAAQLCSSAGAQIGHCKLKHALSTMTASISVSYCSMESGRAHICNCWSLETLAQTLSDAQKSLKIPEQPSCQFMRIEHTGEDLPCRRAQISTKGCFG